MARRRTIITPQDGADFSPATHQNGPSPQTSLYDLRFRSLLGAEPWSRLPASVRARFSKRLPAGASVTYAGRIVQCHRTLAGRLLAWACLAIGGPLPLSDDVGVPAAVTLTQDGASGGQFWTRIYGRRHGFPQVIHSSKRFAGPTGLEEYLGRGFGIALTISSGSEALHFHSDHYFFQLGRWRLRLPRLLSPGALTISHIDFGSDSFAFVLSLRHSVLGELILQTGIFSECRDIARERTWRSAVQ